MSIAEGKSKGLANRCRRLAHGQLRQGCQVVADEFDSVMKFEGLGMKRFTTLERE